MVRQLTEYLEKLQCFETLSLQNKVESSEVSIMSLHMLFFTALHNHMKYALVSCYLLTTPVSVWLNCNSHLSKAGNVLSILASPACCDLYSSKLTFEKFVLAFSIIKAKQSAATLPT